MREPLTRLRVLHCTFRVRCAPGICARCVPRKGRCHVDRCNVDIGSDLLSRSLPDLAVARSVEGAADHTDSRYQSSVCFTCTSIPRCCISRRFARVEPRPPPSCAGSTRASLSLRKGWIASDLGPAPGSAPQLVASRVDPSCLSGLSLLPRRLTQSVLCAAQAGNCVERALGHAKLGRT